MTQNAIITDLNRCVSCYTCTVACKVANQVPLGNFWIKVLRVGPNPKYEGAEYPDVEMYYLPVSCQHCKDPECVKVCPTEASHKLPDGTVQIDKAKCIGCQFCVMACPYGVRYLNKDEKVVEKCTLCDQRTSQGELPWCVQGCVGRARFFGQVENGWDSFIGPVDADGNFQKITDTSRPFTDADVHYLPNVGNNPSFAYILRNRTWQGGE